MMLRRCLAALGVLLAGLAGAEPITLRYACMDGQESLPAVRALVEAFEKANPGIRVRIEPTTDEYHMKLLTQVAARKEPDVAWMNVALVPQYADRGVLMPLDEFADGYPLDQVYPNVLDFYRRDGRLFAFPRDVAPFGMIFYNRTILRQMGLSDPPKEWTWSASPRPQLREKCFTWMLQALTEKGSDGKTRRWAFAPAWPQLFLNLLMASQGIEMWDDNERPTKITANSPEVLATMDFAVDQIVRKNTIPTWYQLESVAQASAYDEFVKGRIAMLMTFAGDIGRLKRDMAKAGFDWDVTLFPSAVGRPPAATTDSSGTVVFARTKHPEAALKFAKWMSGEPGMRAMAKLGNQPANRNLAMEPGVWLPSDGIPSNLRIADDAALAMRFAQTPEYFEETRVYLDAAAFDILSGTRPPEETLNRVARESQQRLDAALRGQPTQRYPTMAAIVLGAFGFLGVLWWVFRPSPNDQLTKKEKREGRVAFLFLAPLLIGMFGLTFGPIAVSFFLSFASSDNIRPAMWRGAMNYVDAFTVDPVFLKSLEVTFTYALLSVPLSTAFALGLAVLLNQPVRGTPLFRSLYYIPSLVSGVVASLIWMRVFNPERGILNSILYWPDGKSGVAGIGGLVSNLAGSPGEPVNWLGNDRTALPAFALMGLWGAGAGTILFLAGLQGVPKGLHEAAVLDGASPWMRFRRVTLPMLSPTTFFTLVTGTIGALQAFTQSFVMTQGGPNNATMFYMLNLYVQGFRALKLGYASALAWILFLIILVLTGLQFWGARRWVYYEGEGK